AHPFSQTALISPSPLAPPSNLLHPPSGASLITHLSRNSIPTSVGGLDPILFSRRHPQRIKPGSVISVVSHTTPARTNTNVFSGVLMGIRRRGVDTSITLRNIVQKTGVEMTYKIFSPLIKEIIIVKRADGSLGGLRDLHRAKLGWLRERPAMMSQIAAALK
ncbi:hypothetical protein TREMEDRAFT_19129, partial [Tremella mesenterica DSM 1558]|uniref:uncharacterized protein n=1 Tax=Tremella mesenterica (strain ATCC 24925 / CBS 8224 / DSM 1558 / NBRC 9311 / NRRL Y-6157 / RJB 2259-6 / UBC 559-6) TaxID=578456 RepID=UPI00032BB4B7